MSVDQVKRQRVASRKHSRLAFWAGSSPKTGIGIERWVLQLFLLLNLALSFYNTGMIWAHEVAFRSWRAKIRSALIAHTSPCSSAHTGSAPFSWPPTHSFWFVGRFEWWTHWWRASRHKRW